MLALLHSLCGFCKKAPAGRHKYLCDKGLGRKINERNAGQGLDKPLSTWYNTRMNYDNNTRIEDLEKMGDAQSEVAADIAAQEAADEVELLSDQEIISLLSEEFVPQNEDYTEEDAYRDFCIEPYEENDCEG